MIVEESEDSRGLQKAIKRTPTMLKTLIEGLLACEDDVKALKIKCKDMRNSPFYFKNLKEKRAKLKHLCLTDCIIPLDTFTLLMMHQWLTTDNVLTSLDLSGCNLKGKGFAGGIDAIVAMLKENTYLEKLDLSDNPAIGDTGFAKIIDVLKADTGNKTLQELTVKKCNLESKSYAKVVLYLEWKLAQQAKQKSKLNNKLNNAIRIVEGVGTVDIDTYVAEFGLRRINYRYNKTLNEEEQAAIKRVVKRLRDEIGLKVIIDHEGLKGSDSSTMKLKLPIPDPNPLRQISHGLRSYRHNRTSLILQNEMELLDV
jgi:hypothetical protein